MKKSECALIQLIDAIRLFNECKYISAVTLAGAANEILEKLSLFNKGRFSASLPEDEAMEKGIGPTSKKANIKTVKLLQNRIKNQLKHHDVPEDIELKADFAFDAQMKITDAITNYKHLHGEYPKDLSVSEYIVKHSIFT